MPTKKLPKLSIIIPAKNEEKRISRTLSTYGAFFESRQDELQTEIIVVVNNTDDQTSRIVSSYASKFPFIHKLETPYSSGKGGAVALGISKADGDYIGFSDADGAIPASEVYSLFEFIHDTPWLEGVIGDRYNSKTQISTKRRRLMRFYNLLVRLMFRLPYRDTQCGAKIFRQKAAKNISKKLSNTGWTFDVNVLLVAKYLNIQVLSQPVAWKEKEGSKLSLFEGIFKIAFELVLLKFREITYLVTSTSHKYGFDFFSTSESDKGKKNILIFAWRDIKHPEMGGSEIYIHEIAKRLAKKHNVTLFTAKPSNLAMTDTIDKVKIIRRGGFWTVFAWAPIYYITKFRKKTDLIIDVENGIPFFTPLYSRKPRMMVLHHVHKNQYFKELPLPFAVVGYLMERFIMPIVYRKTTVVTVSPSTLYELKEIGFTDRQVFIAYNSIPKRVGGKFKEAKDPMLLYVGRLKSYKRVEIALDAVKKLSATYPNIKLVIAGTGDHEASLKLYAKKIGVTDRVEFLGFISEKKKWELLQKAWVFLMPSLKEGWGITSIEAASCGTPQVGFNVPGVRDAIRNNVTGFLAHNKEEYINDISRLVGDKELRKVLGKGCVDWANVFTWDKSVKIYENIFDSLLSYNGFLEDKVYPWELDAGVEFTPRLLTNK